MPALIPAGAGNDSAALTTAADKASTTVQAAADQLADWSGSGSRIRRSLIDVHGLSPELAERAARALAGSLATAARALSEAAQELNAVSHTADSVTDDVRSSGTGRLQSARLRL